MGQNSGSGGRFGRGKGRFSGGRGVGPQGHCVCTQCSYRLPKQAGMPCQSMKCPKCGGVMERDWEQTSSPAQSQNLPPVNPPEDE